MKSGKQSRHGNKKPAERFAEKQQTEKASVIGFGRSTGLGQVEAIRFRQSDGCLTGLQLRLRPEGLSESFPVADAGDIALEMAFESCQANCHAV